MLFFVVFRSFSHNFPLGAPVCTSSRPVKPEIMRNTMKHALKLIFLKCIFEFVINTAPTVSNSVYGREKLFWYDKINFSYHMCHCGAVVQELLARKDKPGLTPGDAVFCFFVPFFFFLFGLFFLHYFSFLAFFSLFLLLTLPVMHLDQKSLSPEFSFGKGISKALDLHTGQAYDHIKTISPVKKSPSSTTAEFFFQC